MKKWILGSIGLIVLSNGLAEDFQFINNTRTTVFTLGINHGIACDIDGPLEFTLKPHTKQILTINHDYEYATDRDCEITFTTWSPTISEGEDTVLYMTFYPNRYSGKDCTQMTSDKFYLCKDNFAHQLHPKYWSIYTAYSMQYFDPVKN